MKKRIFAVLALSLCLTACAQMPTQSQSGKDGYEHLNDMLALHYSLVTLNVKSSFGGASLQSVYQIDYTEGIVLRYKVERFAPLGLNSAGAAKVLLQGEAVIEGGAVVSVSGDDIGITGLPARGLEFKEEYFENALLTGVMLRADVKNPSAFTGANITASDMKVKATFLDMFYDITITYTAEGDNAVEVAIQFAL